jgi:hypothetical protein
MKLRLCQDGPAGLPGLRRSGRAADTVRAANREGPALHGRYPTRPGAQHVLVARRRRGPDQHLASVEAIVSIRACA